MIKEKDTLYFKDNGKKWSSTLEKPKNYQPCLYNGYFVGDYIKINIGKTEMWFNLIDEEATFYIWDWFLTTSQFMAEWRDKQIDSILEDE